eukprot:11181221-Lingulodinium_polyedra.AAC.1
MTGALTERLRAGRRQGGRRLGAPPTAPMRRARRKTGARPRPKRRLLPPQCPRAPSRPGPARARAMGA